MWEVKQSEWDISSAVRSEYQLWLEKAKSHTHNAKQAVSTHLRPWLAVPMAGTARKMEQLSISELDSGIHTNCMNQIIKYMYKK